jgi:hypothetical protein
MQWLKKSGVLIYKGWMLFARGLAFVNTRLILTLFFVIVIGPIALILKLAGKDFLQRRIDSSPSFWRPRESAEHTLENAVRQF